MPELQKRGESLRQAWTPSVMVLKHTARAALHIVQPKKGTQSPMLQWVRNPTKNANVQPDIHNQKDGGRSAGVTRREREGGGGGGGGGDGSVQGLARALLSILDG